MGGYFMVLVDTSVWIDHFKSNNQDLRNLLKEEQILTHPFVIGEIACGGHRQRAEILTLLPLLPQSTIASDAEVLAMLEDYELYGKGIGWVDAHLLSAGLLSRATLWTFDKKLGRLARDLGAS